MDNTFTRSLLKKLAICMVSAGMLVACGGGDSKVSNTESDSQLLANGEACNAAWKSGTAYVGGNKVSYSGRNYSAAYWTQGDTPSSNSGAAGSGKPWITGYTCGGTATTTKATTTKAGATTTKTTTTTTSSSGFVLTQAMFNSWFPNKVPFYTYAGFMKARDTYYPAFGTTGSATVRKQEVAAFFGNTQQESDALRATREYNTANWPLYCSSGACGGKQYYGRGPMQLSWDYNYRSAGNGMGVDLLNNPDLVATDEGIAWRTALWYWMTQSGQAGSTPHNTMVNGLGFGLTIKAINGGLECAPAAKYGDAYWQEMTNRGTYYTNFANSFGVPTGGNLTC